MYDPFSGGKIYWEIIGIILAGVVIGSALYYVIIK